MEELIEFALFMSVLCVGYYLAVIAHELGHALVAVCMTRHPVIVLIGDPERLFAGFTIGRLRVGLGVGFGGACVADPSCPDGPYAAGGPAATAVMVLLPLALAIQLSEAPAVVRVALVTLSVVNANDLVGQLKPRIVPTQETTVGFDAANDGLALARALGKDHLEPDGPGPPAPADRPWAMIALVVFAPLRCSSTPSSRSSCSAAQRGCGGTVRPALRSASV